MTLELQLAVFPQTAEDNKKLFKEKYDANKKYPSHSGTIKVPVSQLPELVSYLQMQNLTMMVTLEILYH